jgi:hypothetical protein
LQSFFSLATHFNYSQQNFFITETRNSINIHPTVQSNESLPLKTAKRELGVVLELSLKLSYRNVWKELSQSEEKLFHHPNYLMNAFRVMIHNTDELPFKANQLYYAPYFETANFLVTPVITQIDDSLISLSTKK